MNHHLTTLPNGLRVSLVPMPGMGSAAISIFVGVGSRYEQVSRAGVAHLIEHMMFKGTERRPRAADISEALDSVGGILNASTDKELTVYWAKVAAEHLPLAVDLLADMLRHSRLSAADLAREKKVVVEELGMLADDPQDWVHVLLDEVLWPGQPLGREVAGTKQSVAHLRRRDLLDTLAAYYGPNNAVLSVAGGIELDETLAMVECALGDWQPVQPHCAPPAILGSALQRSRVEYRPIEQANVCVAFPAISRNHPDRWALDVLTTILGAGSSSRLFLQLRERLGLVYDVHAYASQFEDTGALTIYAGTDAAKLPHALQAIFREVDRLSRRRVPDRELRKAKQYFRGRLWLGLEDTQAVASWFGAQEILHHEVITPEAAADYIDAVTADDVLRVARKYLRPDVARLAAVGPIADLDLESQLLGA